MDVSSRLTSLRESRKISKNHLSKISGVAQSYIGDIESGKKQPTVEILSRLCTALSISLSEFFMEDKLSEEDVPSYLSDLFEAVKKLPKEECIALTRFLELSAKR